MANLYRTMCDRCGFVSEYNPDRISNQIVCVAVSLQPRAGLNGIEASEKFVQDAVGAEQWARVQVRGGIWSGPSGGVTMDFCADCAGVVAKIIRGGK
jgi:hypothetical protein